jgi:hypothetical protein
MADAIGVRLTALPIRAEKVYRALADRELLGLTTLHARRTLTRIDTHAEEVHYAAADQQRFCGNADTRV